MKIDTYQSSTKPSYGLVVPAGTDLSSLQGEVGDAVAKLAPLTPRAKNVTLDAVFRGDLLVNLQAQIAASGAGLVKTQVSFSEVIGD